MSELRHNPVHGSWVIIAPERLRQPPALLRAPVEVAGPCPFCDLSATDAARVLSRRDAPEGSVTVVANRYPALAADHGLVPRRAHGVYGHAHGIGAHEVVIETPRHTASLATLPSAQIAAVLLSWRDRMADLHGDLRLRYVQLYRNEGAGAGASLDHPHSQLIATSTLPAQTAARLEASVAYYALHERCLLCDVSDQEISERARIVRLDPHFIAFCPWASRAPFEVWIAPREHTAAYTHLSEHEARELADQIADVARRLAVATDGAATTLALCAAPNLGALSNAPPSWRQLGALAWHWWIEIVPRLAVPGGFEWGTGMHVNPTLPEDVAQHLRQVEAAP